MDLELPDPKKARRHFRGWVYVMKSYWRYAGFFASGAFAVVALLLTKKPNLLHEIFGIPSTVWLFDVPLGWWFFAAAALLFSTWFCGRRIVAQSVVQELRKPVIEWARCRNADEALTMDEVGVRDLEVRFTASKIGIDVHVSMFLTNRSDKGDIVVHGINLDWVRGPINMILPVTHTLLSLSRTLGSKAEQVSTTFAVAKIDDDVSSCSGAAWISFGYTKHGTCFKSWGNGVNASITVER